MSKLETYEELLKQQEELARKIEEARQSAVSTVINDVKALIEKYNLTADDLGLTTGRAAKGKARTNAVGKVVKYRNPANPNETYGGKGPKPAWLKEKLEQGAKMADFAA
jgi:DNA-binding protein H-NS